MRRLGLHQITAMEAEPPELVVIAAEIGCQDVCLFTNLPDLPPPEPGARVHAPFPLVTQAMAPLLLTRMSDYGIAVSNIEFFSLLPGVDIGRYHDGLALGAELGARRAVTHIFDPEEARAIDNLGRLCDMATGFGLDVALEFMGLAPACNSIARALFFVEQVSRPNLGIAIDALHLVRTGGTAADVAAIDPAFLQYAQLCDGAHTDVSGDYLDEALEARMVPGEGCFPLRELLAALPHKLPLDVEVPRLQLQLQGITAQERARQAVAGARRLIESVTPTR